MNHAATLMSSWPPFQCLLLNKLQSKCAGAQAGVEEPAWPQPPFLGGSHWFPRFHTPCLRQTVLINVSEHNFPHSMSVFLQLLFTHGMHSLISCFKKSIHLFIKQITYWAPSLCLTQIQAKLHHWTKQAENPILRRLLRGSRNRQ